MPGRDATATEEAVFLAAFLAAFFSRFVGTGGRAIGFSASLSEESESESNPSRTWACVSGNV